MVATGVLGGVETLELGEVGAETLEVGVLGVASPTFGDVFIGGAAV